MPSDMVLQARIEELEEELEAERAARAKVSIEGILSSACLCKLRNHKFGENSTYFVSLFVFYSHE